MNSLRNICDYVVTRTNIIENYISTENMLPNKGGVCDTLKVPSDGIGTKYQVGDILWKSPVRVTPEAQCR